ncbi:MAG TPA: hypothetical protein VIU11_25090 [Nakamurella sp.]
MTTLVAGTAALLLLTAGDAAADDRDRDEQSGRGHRRPSSSDAQHLD